MPNRNYVSGANAEREFINLAKATGRWSCTRSAGSKGLYDGVLVCTNSSIDLSTPTPRPLLLTQTGVVLFQMKRDTKSRTKPAEDFKNLSVPQGVVKWWVNRRKGKREFEIEVL